MLCRAISMRRSPADPFFGCEHRQSLSRHGILIQIAT
jgi:hypothetical protein